VAPTKQSKPGLYYVRFDFLHPRPATRPRLPNAERERYVGGGQARNLIWKPKKLYSKPLVPDKVSFSRPWLALTGFVCLLGPWPLFGPSLGGSRHLPIALTR